MQGERYKRCSEKKREKKRWVVEASTFWRKLMGLREAQNRNDIQ